MFARLSSIPSSLAPGLGLLGPWSLALGLSACAATPADSSMASSTRSSAAGPYAVVLGTAQDGGLPQIGCERDLCLDAQRDPARARLVTSLLVADPGTGRRWLFDATPDLPDQVELAREHPGTRNLPGPRPPLFDGIFLTHAHMGHYTGLLYLGREVYGSRDVPLYVSRRMRDFLAANEPWASLLREGALVPHVLEPDRPLELAPGLSVTPVLVPHRDEFTDTFAFIVRGPERAVLYLPDIDKWEHWSRAVEDVIASVDFALLDGTFFADGEIPGRNMDEIMHPFIVQSLERFATLPAAERAKVLFTHLNHSNPASDPTGEAAARIRASGMGVAADGQLLDL